MRFNGLFIRDGEFDLNGTKLDEITSLYEIIFFSGYFVNRKIYILLC